MEGTVKLNVKLWGEVIGRLAWDDVRQVATFQFTERYHELPYNIMPTRPQKPIPPFLGTVGDKYHGLPPFIADSLPDHWGSIIFDRWATENGIQSRACNPLLKLAYIGRRGLGALEFVPDIGTEDAVACDLAGLEAMAQDTYRKRADVVIKEGEREMFETFARLGSPPGGAHSKILIAINDMDNSIISGQTDPEDGFTQYILKFKEDYDVPSCEIEYVYYLMAKDAGIDIMPSRLIEINGRKHFLTQRFDRRDGDKLLTQTMAALVPNATDYQNLFFLCRTLNLDGSARTELFRRMCFNVVAGNTDDHNKNFSFIMHPDGRWELAPAYDVTFTADIWRNADDEIHSLGIYSKRCCFTAEDFVSFGEAFDIPNPGIILDDVRRAVSKFRTLAQENGIQQVWRDRISRVLEQISL